MIDKIVAKNGREIGRVLQSVHGRWLMRIIFFLFRESVKQYYYSDFSAISFKFALQRALRFIVDNKIEGSYYEFGLFEGNSFFNGLGRKQKIVSTGLHTSL